jgi:N-acyl-D-amino-acid deacylase
MITGKAADRFELRDRGRIVPGALADITVFDAGTIAGPADYEHPSRPPEGISLVLREGRKQFASPRNLA